MTRKSKRFRKIAESVDVTETYTMEDAVATLKKCPPTKFDQSVEVSIRMGLDPRKADQQVRSTVMLPNGTGKKLRVVALCQGDKIQEALDAGADHAGAEELCEKIRGGWTDFDVVVATPDLMREVGKLGKVLGPRGLMPSPKAGTVTQEVAKIIGELKKGKVEFKVDRNGVINSLVGKLSFEVDSLVENLKTLIGAIVRAKPPGAKGQYLQGITVSSTMGPGLKIDLKEAES